MHRPLEKNNVSSRFHGLLEQQHVLETFEKMFDSFLECYLVVLRLDGTTAIRRACSNKPLSNPTVMSQVGIPQSGKAGRGPEHEKQPYSASERIWKAILSLKSLGLY